MGGFNSFFLREKLEMKKGFQSITFHLVTQKKLSISSTTNRQPRNNAQNQIQIKMRKNMGNVGMFDNSLFDNSNGFSSMLFWTTFY
jgi:hypothetical protein